MRAERRETRAYGLLITDVREYLVDNRKPRLLAHRYRHSRLCHRRKKSKRFEQNRFPTGVGAGYQKGSLVRLELEIERHNRNPLSEKQRMSTVLDRKTVGRASQLKAVAIELNGESTARVECVELDQCIEGR